MEVRSELVNLTVRKVHAFAVLGERGEVALVGVNVAGSGEEAAVYIAVSEDGKRLGSDEAAAVEHLRRRGHVSGVMRGSN